MSEEIKKDEIREEELEEVSGGAEQQLLAHYVKEDLLGITARPENERKYHERRDQKE